MVYTYVIRSKKDKKWYTGTTPDLRKRLNEHNDNEAFPISNGVNQGGGGFLIK
jgi:predicted GIY-YIG superfamily endonuclease